jgi:hypothetical protein
LARPYPSVLVKSVAELPGNKFVIRISDLALMQSQVRSPQAPVPSASFKVIFEIKDEPTKRAHDVVRNGTIGTLVAAIASCLKCTDVLGLSDPNGVELMDGGRVVVLLEKGGIYVVGS